MSAQHTPKWASRVAAEISDNVKAVDACAITWDEFSARQRKAWDSVTRGELNIIASACHRRMATVHIALTGSTT